VENAFNKNAL